MDGITNKVITALLRQAVETALARQEDAKLGTYTELGSFKKSGAIK